MSRPPNTPSPYPNVTLFSVILCLIQKWSVCIPLYIGICIRIFLCISHKCAHRLCLHASKHLFYYSSCFSKPDVPLDHLWFLLQLPRSVPPLHTDRVPPWTLALSPKSQEPAQSTGRCSQKQKEISPWTNPNQYSIALINKCPSLPSCRKTNNSGSWILCFSKVWT